MLTLLFVVLLVLVIAGLPTWSYSRTWGPAPSGLLGLLLIILLVLFLTGNLHLR